MPGVTIVLNGVSSSGKTSIANALQRRWDGPLQVSGIDSFLSLQSPSFFGYGSESADGLTWRPTVVDGVAAMDIVPGRLGSALFRAAQRFWRACADEDIDQVCDDVWLTQEQVDHFKATMSGVDVLWVGVRCPLDVLEQRELRRPNRNVGQARAQVQFVHTWTTYNVEVDTSKLTPDESASVVLDALRRPTR